MKRTVLSFSIRSYLGSINPTWLTYLCIAFGVLFAIMLLINIFLCSAMTCSCTKVRGVVGSFTYLYIDIILTLYSLIEGLSVLPNFNNNVTVKISSLNQSLIFVVQPIPSPYYFLFVFMPRKMINLNLCLFKFYL